MDNAHTLAQFTHTAQEAVVYVAVFTSGNVEVIGFVTEVRHRLTNIPVDTGTAQHGSGAAPGHCFFGGDHTQALCAVNPEWVIDQQRFVVIDLAGEIVHKLLERGYKFIGDVAPQATGPEVAAHHALPRNHLEHVQDHFTFTEAIQEYTHRAEVEGMGSQPDQMAIDARQFRQNHSNHLRTFRHIEVCQLFDSHAVHKVVAHRVQVIDAIRHDHGLFPGLRLHVLFDARMEVAHIRDASYDVFAIKFQ